MTNEEAIEFTALFDEYGFEEPIEAFGSSREYSDTIDINYSSILTRLIQEAGRYCEHYASDLFIDWAAIYNKLLDGSLETNSFLFGFREYGVDGNDSIFSNIKNASLSILSHYYRSIWKLDVEVTYPNDSEKNV